MAGQIFSAPQTLRSRVIALREMGTERLKGNVAALLGLRHMTQKDLADAVGLSQPQISQILSRKRDTPLATLDRIAKALDVDVEVLFARSLAESISRLPVAEASDRTALSQANQSPDGGPPIHGSDSLVSAEQRHELSAVLARLDWTASELRTLTEVLTDRFAHQVADPGRPATTPHPHEPGKRATGGATRHQRT